jgi:hypothetical protein
MSVRHSNLAKMYMRRDSCRAKRWAEKERNEKKNVKYQGQAQRFNVAGGGVCVRGLLVCVYVSAHRNNNVKERKIRYDKGERKRDDDP